MRFTMGYWDAVDKVKTWMDDGDLVYHRDAEDLVDALFDWRLHVIGDIDWLYGPHGLSLLKAKMLRDET